MCVAPEALAASGTALPADATEVAAKKRAAPATVA